MSVNKSYKQLICVLLMFVLLASSVYMPVYASGSTNLVVNPGFETGSLSPWTGAGTFAVVNNNALSGTYSARIEGTGGNSSFIQTIYGLRPNTTYTVTGWYKVESGSVSIGVINYGDDQIAFSTSSTSYEKETFTFTTGASNTSAQIFLWKGDAGFGYGDNFSVTSSDSDPDTGSDPGTIPDPDAPKPIGMPGNWDLVFADEFDGSSLDNNTWSPSWYGAPGEVSLPVNPYEFAAYDPAQVSVESGYLSLTAISNPATINGTTYPYRTGLVHSNGKKQFTYGAFEARIYSPAASEGVMANWPAFWTDGQNWPTDGEMDIMEGLGGQAAYHFISESGNPGFSVPGDYTGWHTFAADWEPGIVNYYYDGVLVGTLTSGITSSPMYLILTYAVGIPYGGPVVIPSTMKVDYVRVWQHPPTPGFTSAVSQIDVQPDHTVSIDIVRADDVKNVSGTFELDLPDGWSVASGHSFTANSSKDTITLNVPKNYNKFKDVIRITPVVGETRYPTMEINSTTLGLYTTEVYPTVNNAADGYLINFKFNNTSFSTFNNINVKVQGPNDWSQIKTISKVDSKESRVVSFPVPTLDKYNLHDYTFTLQLSDDYSVTVTRPINALIAVKAKEPITIDSSIDSVNWEDAASFVLDQQSQSFGEWSGPDDLSARGKVKWDDDYLYLAIDVKDDIHSMVKDNNLDRWDGDSVQIAIDPARAAGPVTGGPHLGFTTALNSNSGAYGVSVDRSGYQELHLSNGQLLSQSQAVVKRDEPSKTTTYRIAFAWSEIMPAAYRDAKDIGIAVVVNDSDGSARKGWIKYMDGIASGKDPAQFGDLLLTETTSSEQPNQGTSPVGGNPPLDRNPPIDGRKVTVTADMIVVADGKTKIELPISSYIVDLPASLLNLQTIQMLELRKDHLSLGIPAAVLNQLLGKLTLEQLANSHIQLRMEPLEDTEAREAITRSEAASHAAIRLSGDVYNFELSILTPDGTSTVVSTFDQPLTLRLKADADIDSGLGGIYFVADNGTISYIDGVYQDGYFEASISHFSKYAILEVNRTFTDLLPAHWANRTVKELAAKQIVNGTSATTFEPDRKITRAEFAALLVNALKLTKPSEHRFDDVAPTAWYAGPVSIAYGAGIVNGKSSEAFDPNGSLTREEMAVMLVKAYHVKYGAKEIAGGKTFADADRISGWAKLYVYEATDLQLLQGRGNGLFVPKSLTTRVEAAQAIYNLI